MVSLQSIGEKLKRFFYYPEPIIRDIKVNGRSIEAKYNPVDGELKFYNKEGEPYELNGAGVFSTLNAVFNAFRDIDMRKISYDLNKSDSHVRTKERLYARELKKRGYQESRWNQRRSVFQYHRTWIKKTRKEDSGLERTVATASVISLIAGVFVISPIITGNTIADLSVKKTSFIGGSMLIISLIMLSIWLKIKKDNLKKIMPQKPGLNL